MNVAMEAMFRAKFALYRIGMFGPRATSMRRRSLR
jgi:hypothetical protein